MEKQERGKQSVTMGGRKERRALKKEVAKDVAKKRLLITTNLPVGASPAVCVCFLFTWVHKPTALVMRTLAFLDAPHKTQERCPTVIGLSAILVFCSGGRCVLQRRQYVHFAIALPLSTGRTD